MLEGLAYLHYSCIYEQNEETPHIALKPIRGLVSLLIAACAYVTGAQAAEASPTMQPGDSGENVDTLHVRLRGAKCLPDSTQSFAIDGDEPYDETTSAAVRSLQRQHGLLMNGVADEQTARAIEAGLFCSASEDSAALKLGDQSEEVRLLQVQLNNWGFPSTGQQLQLTGTFDPATQAALKEFEQFFGLKEDGIFDPLDSEVLWTPKASALLRHLNEETIGKIDPALRNLQPAEKIQIISTTVAQMESGGKYTAPGLTGLTYSAVVLGILKDDAQDEIPTLIGLLSNEDTSVRASAAEALSYIGVNAQEAIPRLITLSSNTDEKLNVRIKAIEALGYIGDTEQNRVVPALLTIVKDENNDEIRGIAVDSLGQIGPAAEAAVPTLITLFDDWRYSDSDIQEQSLNDEFVHIEGRGSCNPLTPERVVLAIANVGSRAVPELVAALQHPDDEVRYGAAFTLGKMPLDATADAVEPLQAVMNNQNENIKIRWRAASTLQAMGIDTQDFFSRNNLEDLNTRREARNDFSPHNFNEYIGQYVRANGKFINDCGDDGQSIALCLLRRKCE